MARLPKSLIILFFSLFPQRFSSIEPRSPTSPQSPKEGDNYHIYPLPNDDDEVFADEKEVPKTYSDIAPSPPTPGTAPSTESKNWRRRQLLLHHVILIVLGVVIVLGLAVGIALAIMFVNTSGESLWGHVTFNAFAIKFRRRFKTMAPEILPGRP